MKEAIDKANAEIDKRVSELTAQIRTIEGTVRDTVFAGKLATIPEALRADLKAALAAEPTKRSEVQKYLADKLGPLVIVKPETIVGWHRAGFRLYLH